ncbi:MAG: hypothetical protein OK442_02785 [Thaumarchaeota archaeon]|nr:hypothetical protein [Nitrososphaerota archaeon]
MSAKARGEGAAPRRIVGACFVELVSLTDLARLSCAFERAPFPIFMSKEGSKYRLAVQTDLFMGIPIFYHIEVEKGGEFLAYKSSGEVEEALLVDAALNPSYMYAPIVHVLKLPRVLERQRGFKARFLAAQVSDLANLMKIASYKMLYEEPPLPLYTFKNGTSWIAGCFARLDDFEEASLFFYARLEKEPSSGFVRYSASRLVDTDFSKRIDEHGSIYVKVVKLKEKHPLVEFK